MKLRTILASAAAGFILLAGIMYFVEWNKPPKAEEPVVTIPTMPPVNELPNLSVQLGDQSTVQIRDLSGDILLIFFNPDCDHCQEAAREIAANKSMFDDWQLYFITSMEVKAAEEFGVNYRLTEPNYKFGHAGVSEVYNSVGALNEVPTIFIYSQGRFIDKFEGTVAIERLRKIL